MKSIILSLATIMIVLTFSVSTVLYSQNKETVKATHKNLKQSEQKVEQGSLQTTEKTNTGNLNVKVESPKKSEVKSTKENEKKTTPVNKVPMKKHVEKESKKEAEKK